MNLKQDEMCTSYFFNRTIDHIRARHLFLSRSCYFDRYSHNYNLFVFV
jgi:hypothetical protein